MSKRVAQLLDEPEHQVTKLISKLEDKNGYPSHDVRLLAENVQKIRSKMIDLGLDPDDTTGEELYHALLVKFQQDSNLFDVENGAITLNFDQKSAKATNLLSQKIELPRVWALKNSMAKNILRQHLPKKVMKQLRYRSIESLLKREDIAEIFLAAQAVESTSWLKAQARLISRLDQVSFELRAIKLVPLSYKRWSNAGTFQSYVVEDNSVGAIGLWPDGEVKNSPLLSMMLMLLDDLDSYNHIRLGQVAAANLSQTVSWWADMDHLVASLSSEHVSLSLKDCALNFLHGHSYADRLLDHGQSSFWKELLSRYENQLAGEADFDESVRQKIANLKFKAPEPAFDFVEDL